MYTPRATHALVARLGAVLAVTVLFACAASAPAPHEEPPTERLSHPWPPVVGQPYPALELLNHRGEVVELTSLAGKVLLIEPIGVDCPACNAFAGAATKGAFARASFQKGVPDIDRLLSNFAKVRRNHPDLVIVHMLLYDVGQRRAPTVERAAAWVKHFSIYGDNEVVLVGTQAMIGPASYNMIPGFQLVDRNFVLVSDSTGHHPRNSLFKELMPALRAQLEQRR